MVSFQCEACGDVLTKKKTDSHRSHCHGASFSCLDCMVHFRGTDYRSHTACITEDQKYQGHLYREKASKATKRKSVSIIEPNEEKALVPLQPYVEDVPDVDAPPHVPDPPVAGRSSPAEPVNVFDFLVPEKSPKEFREVVPKSHTYRNSEETVHSKEYEEQGFAYGAEPVNPRPGGDVNGSLLSLEFMTPAAKETRKKLDRQERPMSASHSRTNSGSTSDKKRKRGHVDEHVTHYELEGDTLMPDAPPTSARPSDTRALAHSGLTGSITRLLSDREAEDSFPPSPDDGKSRPRDREGRTVDRRHQEDPASPLKRSRHFKEQSTDRNGYGSGNGSGNGLGISIKGRASKAMSLVGTATLGALLNPAAAHNEGQAGKTRRRVSSSEHSYDHNGQSRLQEGDKRERERKKHKVHRHNGTARENVRYESRRSSRRRKGSDASRSRSPEMLRSKVKAIEYHPNGKHDQYETASDTDDGAKRVKGESQMVIFGKEKELRLRCEAFLAFVTKGPDSERGCSMNKALKRFHRDAELRRSDEKMEVERELWKSLRLRRNERNEVVLFF